MVTVRVVMADPAHPSPEAARALQHVQLAAKRFGDDVTIIPVAVNDPMIQQLGVGVEPTVLIDNLAVSVGTAPPAGHLVRAIEAAMARGAGT